MCISCPHLVLTAAAGWLLMHPESRMGTWEQTNPKRTSNSKRKGHLPMTGPTQPGTVCISTLGPLPSAHKQQPPFTTAVFLSFHPPLIHATGALKTPAPSCVYHPAQVPTQCYLRVHLSAERPAGSPSWGSLLHRDAYGHHSQRNTLQFEACSLQSELPGITIGMDWQTDKHLHKPCPLHRSD